METASIAVEEPGPDVAPLCAVWGLSTLKSIEGDGDKQSRRKDYSVTTGYTK